VKVDEVREREKRIKRREQLELGAKHRGVRIRKAGSQARSIQSSW